MGRMFPSLTETEEHLLRATLREEVAEGVRSGINESATGPCMHRCSRMRLLLWLNGGLYLAVIGQAVARLF